MKTFLIAGFAVLSAASLPAQIIRPEAVNGAVLGGLAGAVIGNNSGGLHHNAWRGAAIGAGAGLLLGSVIGEANDYRSATQVPVPAPRTYVYRGAPGYYSPAYYSSDVVYADDDYAYGYRERPNYAGQGLLLGGLAGAIIGNNSGGLHHNAWRGAGYGAAAGFLLGAIAENNARRREAALTRLVASPAPGIVSQPAPMAPALPASEVTAAPPPPSPMASANGLFGRN